jgi:hypothetical protein
MTPTPKPPTPQGVSALLERAGFERGVSRPEDQAADGYAVIPNRPGDGIVLVNWWGADEGEHAGMLHRYAETIEGAGYRVCESADAAYLIVTAKEADQ